MKTASEIPPLPPFKLTPRAIVRQRYRFYRLAHTIAWLVLVLSIAVVLLRGTNPLLLWLPILLHAFVSSRWDHWRTERFCLHTLLVGTHRGRSGRPL